MKAFFQRGLSMIELLVALALSSFLVLGVTQIYIDNKRNYLFQQGQIGNLENGRFTLMTLEEHVAKAGYRRRPDQDMVQAFPAGTYSAGTATCTFTAGQAISKVDDTTICLRYQPRDANELDCAGADLSATWTASEIAAIADPYTTPQSSTPAAGAIVERIAVAGGQLSCNSAVLVDGIEDVRFGFGVGPSGERVVNEYVTNPTNSIRSLRYELLMASENANLGGEVTNQAYCDWNSISPCAAVADSKLYQVISSGITIRNLMP